jgi:methylmalonyl-CoA mutase
MSALETTRPKLRHPVRIVTAASLFDGHDAAINIMRRILQSSGAEVIHLGHNRAAGEIVDCAIQEDAHGIAVTSYQGGHVEFFKYMHDLLRERGSSIRIFGGGGGTILPSEIDELHAYGIDRIYSPDDGRSMGLQGMIDDLLTRCDFETVSPPLNGDLSRLSKDDPRTVASLITVAENHPDETDRVKDEITRRAASRAVPVLGVTGPGGSGKSSLVDEIVRRFLLEVPDRTVAIVSVDPSRRKSGGALLGDRIRMNAIYNPRVYMRSLATRQSNLALSRHVQDAIDICKAAGYDLIIVETSGIGQSDTEITEHADVSLYVMTSEYGAASQLEKIDMLDFADLVAINKFDKQGSLDALRDVRKQVRRNRQAFSASDEDLPVYGTIASQFNDAGTTILYRAIVRSLEAKTGTTLGPPPASSAVAPAGSAGSAATTSAAASVIPPDRVRYLAEISEASGERDTFVEEQVAIARALFQIHGSLALLRGGTTSETAVAPDPTEIEAGGHAPEVRALAGRYREVFDRLAPECRALLRSWPEIVRRYDADEVTYQVRDTVIRQPLRSETLSRLYVPRIALPRYHDWGDLLRWLLIENVPGSFPFTAGVFPLKREGEDPARMFAGEGGPERTNRRFHYVSQGLPAQRLSTAFDSVTLYGENPSRRPDIYGKIGNSGVSIATVDDAKKLYSGFNLAEPTTSVSMTINGPAPMLLAFFMNAAIDQQCEIALRADGRADEATRTVDEIFRKKGLPRPRFSGELPPGNDGLGLLLLGVSGDDVLSRETYERIKADTLRRVRGTVQADILKEDQAQNTCIFSTEFALRMMGDIQRYFIDHDVRNFYSVSISGYHIAEAGANPITQLAFTLANGFTYVEYYLSRGMHIDDFAPNLSFFFSNGLDPEYAVIGRVARRLWAKAIRFKYGGNERSQKLKYHIQTSGRSLHAQEIAFNDIRTTLQALYALTDNCNSLHTNAYDEAITTPTEESVRRALAIQLIINKELGITKNENPGQGSFFIERLTDLVEEAVLREFRSISERGGVLGAMERMYQRSRIQEESLTYESMKHDGRLPIVGVNTFLDRAGSPTILPKEVIRSSPEEREFAIASLQAFEARNAGARARALTELQRSATTGGNTFESLMEVAKVASLGQITSALYDVGGQYRRSM